VSDFTEDDFSKNVRDVLLSDPQLVRLLGGPHIFCSLTPDRNHPRITIAQSMVPDWSSGRDKTGQGIVSLQVWSQTGKKTLAQEFLDTTHSALVSGGFMKADAPIRLCPEFSGSRKMPEGKGFHGVLRYHAERRNNAA